MNQEPRIPLYEAIALPPPADYDCNEGLIRRQLRQIPRKIGLRVTNIDPFHNYILNWHSHPLR
jgi:hypothetical protein